MQVLINLKHYERIQHLLGSVHFTFRFILHWPGRDESAKLLKQLLN